MDGHVRVPELAAHVFFQVVAHFMSFLQGDLPRHDQVQVDIALAAGLARAEPVEADNLPAEVFRNGRLDEFSSSSGSFTSTSPPKALDVKK